MSIDAEITSRLADIASKLETISGIDPDPALVRDTTITSRLKRIEDAISAGVLEAHNLSSHLDVEAASPVDGDFLRYDAGIMAWINSTMALIDATDVASSTSPIAGNYLRGNGTQWSNSSILLADLPAINLDDLNDVQASSPANEQIIQYDTVSGDWILGDFLFSALGDVSLIPGTFYLVQSDGTTTSNDTFIEAADVLLRDGSVALTADWDAGTFDIEATEFRIKGTADHRIYDDGSDNLVIENPNADTFIICSVNKAGVGQYNDFLQIRGDGPNLEIKPTTAVSLPGATPGIIDVGGSWSGGVIYSVLNFAPTFTGGGPLGAYFRPVYDIANASGELIRTSLKVGSAKSTNTIDGLWTLNMQGTNVDAGQDQYYGGIKDSFTRTLLTADTYKFRMLQLGGTVLLNAVGTVEDISVHLTGGAFNLGGGTLSQYGIKLEGYGSNIGSVTQYAIHSNGGTFAWVADNAKIKIGASEDAEIYFDGSDLIIDPDSVTATASVNIKGDMEFSTSGAGLPFGEIYVNNNAATMSVVSGSWTQVTDFNTNGQSNQCTPDHTNDHITIDVTGIYLVTCSITTYRGVGTGAWVVTFQIYTNNGTTPYPNLYNSCDNFPSGIFPTRSFSISGIAAFTANDTVELWATASSAPATSIAVTDATLSVVQIGA